ncbi:ThiF family adenylyltransferase, partial [Streptomyces sp. SID13588]|uniref:ThiF family adenylyltransferase n=1 Tax=Streptomyces sp. SID13588 TaxID=2706051 RepID=UPI001EF279AA
MLKTAMRRSWRNRESMQFGIDPAHAVVLDSVDGAAAGFLDLLDGTRGAALLTRDAEALGLGAQQVRQLLGLLAEGGVLDDAAAHARLSEAVRHRTAAIDRLRPDLAALSVVHAGPGGAAGRMRDRRAARVRVRGAGRVGAAVAALLSAAGVGRVEVLDGGRVEPWD